MSMSMLVFFFFKQKTAYEMLISDWSSDVCSSDLDAQAVAVVAARFIFPALFDREIGALGLRFFQVMAGREMRALPGQHHHPCLEIGRQSCRERVCPYV